MPDQPTTAAPGLSADDHTRPDTATVPAQSRGAQLVNAEPPPKKRAFPVGPAALAAIVTFLIATPIAYLLPKFAFQAGPGGIRSLGVPLAAGLGAVVLIFLVALRRPTAWLAGASAGGFSAWIVLSLSTAMHGTPFPFFGLVGDAGRLTGMATRYSVTPVSSDMMIPGLPSEYPPLFPWLVGRASALIDVPAWRLVGDFEILFIGLAVIAGFLLWQRLFSPWLALIVTVLCVLTFPRPDKAYEVVTLMVFLPWVLLTFMNPPKGRLHWLVAGLIGGFIIQTYYGWLLFGFFGVATIAFLTWRGSADRKALLWYYGKVAAVAVIAASWFVVPLIYAKATIGGSTVADLYGSSNMLDQLFPFMQITYPGVAGIMAVNQLIGLVGMIWLRDRTWWARPMFILVVGAYAYRAIGGVAFVLTDHTLLSQYTPGVYVTVMAAAAAPTLAYATPKLLSRLSITAPKGAAAIAMAVLVGWCGYTFCIDWMPGAGGRFSDYTERAYQEPYPDGHYIKGTAHPTPWFPVTPIQERVESVLGPNPNAVVLSADERLFAYLPWHGYIGNDLWSSIAHSYERLADIENLAAVKDPTAFTAKSQSLDYGRIDIFVLSKVDNSTWRWNFHRGFNQPEANVDFTRSQFDTAQWVIADDLPENYVLVIRREV
jgi:hypothetical protein